MKELMRTNDPVLLSFIEVLLKDQNIDFDVFDRNMSVMEGSIGVLPRRIVVPDEQFIKARRVIEEAGIELPAKG